MPISIDTQNLPCLVVGAGDVAARKISMLSKTHCQITVVAPEACHEIRQLAKQGRITYLARAFEHHDLALAKLVYLATNNPALHDEIAHLAKAYPCWLNVVDTPALCDFITPALVERAPITVAISSGGSAPVLVRFIRDQVEKKLPQQLGRLATLADQFRATVKARFNNLRDRRLFWEANLQGTIAELALQGKTSEAAARLDAQLTNIPSHKTGLVALVGAGPGDPELLTIKALRLLQKADVVIYDRLVSPQIMDKVRRDADKIYVGKQKSHHSLPQEQINQLLVKRAKQGELVVRLKGGDPFIFGRGGEEIETLFDAGVHFQVVPGITAAAGAASYAGIPLTHRDHAQSVTFATGHLCKQNQQPDWPALARPGQTLVFYMGLGGLQTISQQLIKYGLDKHTPVALVQEASCPGQRVITGSLQSIYAQAQQANIQPPTLIIIGTVVNLQQKLHWFAQAS